MLIKLKVHPDSRKNSLAKKAEDAYEIWVKEPAQNGRANQAALALLAQAIGRQPRELHIIKGAQTPNKIVKLLGS